jgi:type II secretory ATPase GspE/PulE/Tfp pilus assembly ATPase PilB-like protein
METLQSEPESRLGDLLIERRLITLSQLQGALLVQQEAGGYLPLGQILIDRGLITRRQLHLILEWTKKRPKLGEVLVKSGAIDADQLQRALQEQGNLRLPLGETLVKLGYLTEETMRQALCLQLNIPYLDLDRLDIDVGLARLVNRSYATRHHLVPLARVADTLTVAMDDPADLEVIDELTRSSGCSVRVVTSSFQSIEEAIARLYDRVLKAASETSDEGFALVSVAEAGPLSEYSPEGRRADGIVRQILNLGIEKQCSDIHLEPLSSRTLHVRFRVDGVLQELDLGPLQQACNDNVLAIISRIKILGKLDISERRRPQDGSFRLRADRPTGEQLDFDFRLSVVPSYYGESVVVRILDRRRAPKSIDELGFPQPVVERLRAVLKRPSGIFLITGPTGSGKSTTLYAALMTVYRPQIRIVTVEDPIEYVYEQFSQSEVNERIGNTFAKYLRALLRHDPEVMMVGEIRDEETAEMAFRAAQTGHLLLSTLHTNDAVSAVLRLVDLKVEPTLISSSLIAVLSQRLVRTICPQCRETYRPSDELMREFFDRPPADIAWYRGRGCEHCEFTGYRGRRLIAELWIPSENDVVLISKSAPLDELRASSARTTYSLAESALLLLKGGHTNLEELIRMVPYASVYRFRELVTQ